MLSAMSGAAGVRVPIGIDGHTDEFREVSAFGDSLSISALPLVGVF
jgi:hypothetical protein